MKFIIKLLTPANIVKFTLIATALLKAVSQLSEDLSSLKNPKDENSTK